jgi:hypothetical protein
MVIFFNEKMFFVCSKKKKIRYIDYIDKYEVTLII